jgi:hypothetical protein
LKRGKAHFSGNGRSARNAVGDPESREDALWKNKQPDCCLISEKRFLLNSHLITDATNRPKDQVH